MVNFMLEYKWTILLLLEVFAWLATFFAVYARYRMKSSKWFKISLILLAVTGFIPQALLGIVNFCVLKEFDLFMLVIALLIGYGFTFGKKHIQQLDKWGQKKFSGDSTL